MSLLILKWLRKFVKALVSGDSPRQIALGFSLGAIMGLTPSNLPVTLFVLSLLFIFNINFTAGILCSGILSSFSHLFFPLAHKIGFFLLVEQSSLTALWTSLYNLPFIPFTNFNNTVMLGSLVLALLAQVPLYFLSKKGVVLYREKIHNLKIIKVIKSSAIGQWAFKIWSFFK